MAADTNGHLVESSTSMKKGRQSNLRLRKLRNRRRSLAARILSICARYAPFSLTPFWLVMAANPDQDSREVRSTYKQRSRLATWFVLSTVIFKCPSSPAGLTDTSSRVCRPYLAIRSQFTPYLEPYYDSYAAPYVNSARPYFEEIDKRFLTPTFRLGTQTYENYCAPRVEGVRENAQKQWQNTVKPQLEAVAEKAWEHYGTALAPHVNKAISASTPYFELAKDNLLLTYYSHLIPAYTSSVPHIERTYAYGRDFTVHTGIPYAQGVWRGTIVFIDRILWPKLRILYGENVEPQLVRIGQRLGRYRDGKRVRAVADQVDSSLQSSSTPSILSPTSPSVVATHTTPPAEQLSTPSSATSSKIQTAQMTDEEIAREKVTEDLRIWHEKFAKAADKGAEDLEERVKEITEGQISRQAHGVGAGLVVELEETINREFRELKVKIIDIIKAIPSTVSEEDLEKAEDDLLAAIRTAGLAMKGRAVALRTWKHAYFEETDSLVASATEATVEVLDNIRDLGLQEIGMRWAWMEGVTYKDWSEYHALRETFDEWRDGVEAAAKKHQGLAKAKEAGDDVEGRGMAVAEEAAAELRRLKEVAKWKIEAQDSNSNFDIKHVPAVAVGIGQKILKKAKDAVSGSHRASSEPTLSQVTDKTAHAGSIDQNVSPIASEAVLSTESSIIKNAATGAPEALTEQLKAEGIVSAPLKDVEESASDTSEAVVGTPQPSLDSLASERVECTASTVSEGIRSKESPLSFPDNFSSVADAANSKESLLSSNPSKKVWGGASAQQVDARQIVYEASDRGSGSKTPLTESIVSEASSYGTILSKQLFGSNPPLSESIISKASGYAAEVTDGTAEQYEAIKALISELVSGREPDFTESVMNRLNSAYHTGAPEIMSSASSIASEAYETASSVITSIFTPPPELEAILDSAGERVNAAVEVVSIQLYGTPKGTFEQATSAASEAYDSVSSHISGAIYGTPTGFVEVAQSSVSEVAASAQSAISVAIYGTERGYIEQATSAASKAYESASSIAADSISAVSSVIEENVSTARVQVSEAIYGTPPGVVESAQSRLSSAIHGSQKGALESAQSRLKALVETARARLNELVESAGETAGQGISAAKENIESVASEASNAAGSAATRAGLHIEL